MNETLEKISRQLEQYTDLLKLSGVEYVPSVAQAAAPSSVESQTTVSLEAPERLMQLRAEALACTRCSELAAHRNTVVFGSGNTQAELVFVGEAPGFHEDQQGLPFVGKAGELLTKMIEAMGFSRKDVYICNVLKCRPPNNRNPSPEEVRNCEPYLLEQIKLIKPKVICAMGNFAAQTLLKSQRPISQLRGTTHDYNGTPCVATFHPAYLLRNPQDKRKAWDDLKTVMTLLGRTPKK